MPKSIVLSGYYGFGNTGDEAVLAGILATFRQIGLDARVTVLSADPARTIAEHPGVDSIHRYKLGGLIKTISKADLVISGGGSLFQDVTSARSVRYYLFVLQLAQLLRRKTMIYAQGVGPLNASPTRRAVAGVLNKTNLITVRDQASRALLQTIGVTRPRIHVTADPALMLQPDLAEADRIITEAGMDGADLIGISLRPWNGAEKHLDEATKGITAACKALGARPALVPMQEAEDTQVCQAISDGVVLRGSGRPAVVKGLVARCGLVVGMRLHALILAAGEGVPFVAISYDPKVSAFASASEAGQVIELASLTSSAIEQAIIQAWAQRQARAADVTQKAAQLKELAIESGKLAASLLA